MNKALSLIGVAAGLCLAAEAYEDLTVGVGEELTISTNSFYNSITVNGTLTLDSKAVVKVENSTGGGVVKVGSGAGVTGTLNVKDGANLTANNNSGAAVYVGHNGGTGHLNVDGANLYTYNLYLGNDNAKSTAWVNLSNEAVAYAQNNIAFGGYHKAATDETSAEVTVESDARLKTWQFSVGGEVPAKVHFRGGLIECWALYNQWSGSFYLDGTPEHPIRTQFNGGIGYFTYYMTTDGKGGKIVFEGDCDWIKEGSGTSSQDLISYAANKYLSMMYTGRTIVKQGGFALRGADLLPKTTDLVLERGASINWGGNWQELKSVTGPGKIYSQGQSDRLTLNVPAGTTTRLSCAIDNALSVVKTGAGTLEVLEDDLGNVTVSDGRLKVLRRADFGYDRYRFKVDSAYSPKYDAVHLSELYLYDGDERVSTPYLEATQPWLFDGNYDDQHKWWITAHYTTDTETSFNDRHATVSYAETRKITSYSWVTAGDSPGSWENGRDPGSWRLQGSMSGASAWQTLSTVGHREYLVEKRHAETKKFDVVFPQPACSNLTVNGNGTLELADGVELSCKAVSVSGGDIVYGIGAKLVSSSAMDSSLSYPVMNGGSFEKAGVGATRVVGGLPGLAALKVSAGTLSIDTGYAVSNRYYRFEIISNKWMAANAPTLPSSDIQKTIQFGEIALYDRRGNRINLDATGTSNLCDGDTATSCYYTKMDVTAYDFPMTLAPEQDWGEAVSYQFAIETKWGGVPDKTPWTWKVYTRASTNDTWTLLDEQVRSEATVFDKNNPWKAWNGGVPWTFGKKCGTVKPAFEATTEVSVAAGATLDVSGTEAATVIGDLSVNLAGAGEIKGGKFAETGVLKVTGYEPGADVTLPLTFVGTVAPTSFAGWSIVVDGVVKPNWGVGFDGTKLSLIKPGIVILVR